jgi:hypothetical protein
MQFARGIYSNLSSATFTGAIFSNDTNNKGLNDAKACN